MPDAQSLAPGALAPGRDGELSEYLRWLTVTHSQRRHAHHHSAGTGPLYQGRFKSFPIQEDDHLLRVCRYVERNPVRAGLVKRARDWPWGSASEQPGAPMPVLADWPVPKPPGWPALLDEPQTDADIDHIRGCIARSAPIGSEEEWCEEVAARLGWTSRPEAPRSTSRNTRPETTPGVITRKPLRE